MDSEVKLFYKWESLTEPQNNSLVEFLMLYDFTKELNQWVEIESPKAGDYLFSIGIRYEDQIIQEGKEFEITIK